MSNEKRDAALAWDGRPPLAEIIPLGLQHVLAAATGIITPAIIVATTCGFTDAEETVLIQSALLMSGIVTVLQAFPLFGRIGSGLPIVMGASFAYVPALEAIGGQFGFSAILGAEILGGIVATLMGIFIKPIKRLFPTEVAGTIIFVIGVSLYPTAVRYIAGGEGTAGFGGAANWLVAGVTFLVVTLLSVFGKGVPKLGSILFGMMAGFLLSVPLGMVDFSQLGATAPFALPSVMPFPIEFVPSACATMCIVYVVNSVEVMGEVTSITSGVMDRMPTDREISGGIVATGVMSAVGSLFGSLPTGTFGQNVGIVLTNRVINRWVFVFVGAFFVVTGFMPGLAGALTLIPQPVIGGATISVFATITMNGMGLITKGGLDDRKRMIVGISAALGLGIEQVSGSLGGPGMPEWAPTVFGSSALVMTTITAIALNLLLPGRPEAERVEENRLETTGTTPSAIPSPEQES